MMFRDPRWAKENVAFSRRSSAGWMAEYMVSSRWNGTLESSDYAQGVQDTVKTRCDTSLVRSTQLLSRPEIGQLCAVFWHQHPVPSLQVATAV